MDEKEKKSGIVLRRGITVLLALAVLFFGTQFVSAYIAERHAAKSYRELTEKVMGQEKTALPEDVASDAEERVETRYPEMPLDMSLLSQLNGDFRGWLYIPLLEISYPIVQGADNDFYLTHSFMGEELKTGCIFMDCGASADWSDRNTFVFGHNTRDGSMFGTLKRLKKEEGLCEQNPWFYIYTEDTVYTYRIFSYYVTSATGDRYMTFQTDESYDAYVNWAVEHSEYDADISPEGRGNLVSLSTCYGRSGTSRRLLVHGVLWAEEPYY